MSCPALPAEIHEIIIDCIVTWAQAPEHRETLSTCALVSPTWHSFVLRHTFCHIRLPRDFLAGGPSNNILRLMEKNPEITRCVKTVSVTFRLSATIGDFNDADFEQFCRLISTSVAYISLYQVALDLASRPLIQSGLLHLLTSPNLRHLLFYANLQTSLLEPVSRHLEDLTLHDIEQVVLDHQDSSKLVKSDLKTLRLWGSLPAMDIVRQTPALYQLFERAEHVDVFIDPGTVQSAILWNRELDWGNCTSLNVTFGCLSSLDHSFYAYWQDFPWESLSALKELKATLFLTKRAPSAQEEVDDNQDVNHPLFLSGPSRVKSLENLRLKCKFLTAFKTGASVYQALQEVHNCLDPTFRYVGGFRSLGHLEIWVDVPGSLQDHDTGMTEEVLKEYVEGCLPSVFGPGGRREVDGWVAHVKAGCYSK